MSDDQQQPTNENPEQPATQEAPPAAAPATGQPVPGADKKVLAGIMGIVFGCLGVHKFILGYTKEGVIMLVVSVVGLALSWLCIPVVATSAMTVIGLIEGIMYLTKSDEEFVNTYITNKKPWF